MADYNIIYVNQDNQHYLWNGRGFDLLNDSGNKKLLFSGRSYTDDEFPEALQLAQQAVKLSFPSGKRIHLKKVRVPVNSISEAAGHSPHMPS